MSAVVSGHCDGPSDVGRGCVGSEPIIDEQRTEEEAKITRNQFTASEPSCVLNITTNWSP